MCVALLLVCITDDTGVAYDAFVSYVCCICYFWLTFVLLFYIVLLKYL